MLWFGLACCISESRQLSTTNVFETLFCLSCFDDTAPATGQANMLGTQHRIYIYIYIQEEKHRQRLLLVSQITPWASMPYERRSAWFLRSSWYAVTFRDIARETIRLHVLAVVCRWLGLNRVFSFYKHLRFLFDCSHSQQDRWYHRK